METWMWILIILGTFVLSAAITFFVSKKYMIKYIENQMNFDDNMIEMAMAQMGGGGMSKKQKEKIKKQLQSMQGTKTNTKVPSKTKNKKVK